MVLTTAEKLAASFSSHAGVSIRPKAALCGGVATDRRHVCFSGIDDPQRAGRSCGPMDARGRRCLHLPYLSPLLVVCPLTRKRHRGLFVLDGFVINCAHKNTAIGLSPAPPPGAAPDPTSSLVILAPRRAVTCLFGFLGDRNSQSDVIALKSNAQRGPGRTFVLFFESGADHVSFEDVVSRTQQSTLSPASAVVFPDESG